ncbi:MAG: ribonuclease P protein subunit [Candidatus Woesearchaeota archaeon]
MARIRDEPSSKFLKMELIGKNAKITSSTKDDDVGRDGMIINETMSTIELFDGEKVRTYLKHNVVLKVSFHERPVSIPGELLALRPEDRLKKIKRRRVRTNG